MNGSRVLASGFAAGLITLLLTSACGHDEAKDAAPTPNGDGSAAIVLPPELPQGQLPRRSITLLLPSTGATGLRAVPAEIFSTASSIDQAKQIIGLLLTPQVPTGDGNGVTAPFPAGTLLRSVFLDGKGTAFVSLSREAITNAPGGSSWELLAVSSLAGTLQRSMPSVKRVQLLIEGQEIETLTGHLDLHAPVSLDDGLVAAP